MNNDLEKEYLILQIMLLDEKMEQLNDDTNYSKCSITTLKCILKEKTVVYLQKGDKNEVNKI